MLTTLEWTYLGVCLFAALLGATYRLSRGSHGNETHTLFQAVVSFIIAVFLTVLLEALLYLKGHVFWLYVALFGLVFSLAAEHVVRLLMNYQNGAKSLYQYFLRWKKVNDLINSGQLDLDQDSSTHEQSPPTNSTSP